MEKTSQKLGRVAFIGNYLPRQCGIATFTTDLCESIANEFPKTSCIVLPMNDGDATYVYPPRVSFEIRENDPEAYVRAAEFLNLNNVDVVCLQHEYGIFGGRAGSHILTLLEKLKMPIVTTFHTILQDPNPDQRRVLENVAALSSRVVVMSRHGMKILSDVFRVNPDKIDFIHHGIPDVVFGNPDERKPLFGVEGKTVLLSFGLLSPDKGIENVISALPAVLERHPDVVYIVLGATHPHVKRNHGETYRLSLHRLAAEKGVAGNVMFYNRFVTIEELNGFISATDIYITPYLKEAQITSGTLAYTVGAGKAVISTPYWYAQEMLAEGRGILVPFADPGAISASVNDLLDDPAARDKIRQRAYDFGREMIWPTIAQRYVETFKKARASHLKTIPDLWVKPKDNRQVELPPLNVDHMRRMTDDTGMFQHATFTIPNYAEGYTTDDNARALIVAVLLGESGNQSLKDLTPRYLAFLLHALDSSTGRFRNFMDYQRRWLEPFGSDDSQGRALWALGMVLGRPDSTSLHGVARRIFGRALPGILNTTSPRAWAFTLIGLGDYLSGYDHDPETVRVRDELAERLLTAYNASSSESWSWFEGGLTYCNAALPHALIVSGERIGRQDMIQTGLESLEWLAHLHRLGNEVSHFVPIGSNGFYTKDGERSRFDQQPVEVQSMVSACLEAYRLTGDLRWRKEARNSFEWFLGRNDLNLPLYDPNSGGCRDGLHPDRANENQGAESTLAFLQSLLELRIFENNFQRAEVVPS